MLELSVRIPADLITRIINYYLNLALTINVLRILRNFEDHFGNTRVHKLNYITLCSYYLLETLPKCN